MPRIALCFGFIVALLFVSLPFLVNASREAFSGVDLAMEQRPAFQGASRCYQRRY